MAQHAPSCQELRQRGLRTGVWGGYRLQVLLTTSPVTLCQPALQNGGLPPAHWSLPGGLYEVLQPRVVFFSETKASTGAMVVKALGPRQKGPADTQGASESGVWGESLI